MSGKDHLKNDKNQNQVNKPNPKINQQTPELVGQFDSLNPNPAVSLPTNHEPIRTKQLLRMQKSVGNRHVSRKVVTPDGGSAGHQAVAFPTVQREMEVSEEGDELEEEADQVAETVMRQSVGAAAPAGDDDEDKPVIQAKMQVNEPNDAYEQEADAVASQVMRMDEEEAISRQPLALPALQRKGSSAPAVTPQMEEEVNGLQSGGSPLPDGEREFFESRMGADFSDVKIHNDSKANNLSNDLEAKAFTVGSSIAFNEGEYQPGSASGRQLLAHELTHVVQQGAAQPQEEEVSRKPLAVQREEEEGLNEGETDEPTPEQKAAALAAAQKAEAIAAQARSSGISETTKSAGEAQTQMTQGEGPSQEVLASVSKGPVSQEKEKSQQADTETALATASAEKDNLTTSKEKPLPPAVTPAPANTPGAVSAEAPTNGSPESATTTAQAAVSNSFTVSENPPDKAPAGPDKDAGYQTVQSAVVITAEKERTHGPAKGEASSAQAAAVSPPAELTGQAQAVQVGQMEQTETPGFDGAAFKAQLMDKIASLTPTSVEEADEFKEDDKLGGVKSEMQGQVDSERTASQAPLENKADEPPNLANATPKPVTPMTPNDPGAQPGSVGAEQGVPKPKGAGEVEKPLAESSQAMDQQMADAQVTDTQLENSNEPEFTAALDSKKEAQKEVSKAPAEYRAFETNQIAGAKNEAIGAAMQGLSGMHDERTSVLANVDQEKTDTRSEDEKKREQIAADIGKLYENTKTKVDAKLSGLDDEVNRVFDEGAAAAKQAFEDFVDAKMEAYKEERYGGWLGWAKWAKDKLFGMPGEVNSFYSEGRQLYIDKMDAVIDNIIAIISTTLAEAKAEVAQGKKDIQVYVDQLPEDCKQIGLDAQQDIQGKFDQLEQNIDSKQNELVDSLAQKYVENLQAVDARIEEMKEANKGLVDKVIDAIGSVIETILKLKNLLLEVLAGAANAIMAILEDPIGFIGNLISAVRQGLNNFVTNIATHLQTGFVEWLTGTMGEAGIQMPENIFSLEGVLDLSLQVLGLTWENFRARAVGIFGENIVAALETGFDIFIILQQEGIMGLWEWIKDKLASLKDQVIDGIKEMLITEVIEAGIQWIIGLIGGPAGAFIKAVQTIYNVVMWFIDNAERIASLISAVSSAITEIAAGNLAGAAKYIEDSLAKFVPTAIGFLASLLGLGDMGKKVRKVIDRIQEPVNSAIDSVLTMIKDFVMKIAKMLGFGGQGKEGGEIGEEMQFSADGESHRLFVDTQGGQATLKVASEEMTLMERLARWEAMLNAPAADDGSVSVPEENKAKAMPLIGRARELLTGADESADYLAQKKQGVKKVEDGTKIQQEQQELEQEQLSLKDVLKQLFELLGEKMPEWKGQAQIKFAQAMADDNLPSGVKKRFEAAALEGLFNLGDEADGNKQWDMLKNIVTSGGYVAQGEAIPVSELEAKGGMTRVMSMSLLYQFNLSAAEKEKYGTFPEWLQAIANDRANFVPNQHLDMGSNVSGRGGIAWWAPRASQQGNTMAELVEELGLNPASYEGGAVRVTLSAEASHMSGFKKPTALDGVFFELWQPAADNVWGVTSGGSLEAIAEAIPLSQATQLEYLEANLPAPKETAEGEIGETIDFTAGAEAHKIWVEGQDSDVKIMMASTPVEIGTKISSWKEKIRQHDEKDQTTIGEEEKTKFSQAKSMLATVESCYASTETSAIEALKLRSDPIKFKAIDYRVQQEQIALKDAIKRLLVLFGEEGDSVDVRGDVVGVDGLTEEEKKNISTYYDVAIVGVGSSSARWLYTNLQKYNNGVVLGDTGGWKERGQKEISHHTGIASPKPPTEQEQNEAIGSGPDDIKFEQAVDHIGDIEEIIQNSGFTWIKESSTAIVKRGEWSLINLGDKKSIAAKKVVVATGAGPEQRLLNDDTKDSVLNYKKVVTLNEFMNEVEGLTPEDIATRKAKFGTREVLIYGANAGVDAADVAYKLGFKVYHFARSNFTQILPGTKNTEAKKNRDKYELGQPIDNGSIQKNVGGFTGYKIVGDKITVSFVHDSGDLTEMTVDQFVTAVGPEIAAEGHIATAETQTGILALLGGEEAIAQLLQPIYDLGQSYSDDINATILGLQSDDGLLEVIGAAAYRAGRFAKDTQQLQVEGEIKNLQNSGATDTDTLQKLQNLRDMLKQLRGIVTRKFDNAVKAQSDSVIVSEQLGVLNSTIEAINRANAIKANSNLQDTLDETIKRDGINIYTDNWLTIKQYIILHWTDKFGQSADTPEATKNELAIKAAKAVVDARRSQPGKTVHPQGITWDQAMDIIKQNLL